MYKYTIYFHSALWKLTGNIKSYTLEGDSYVDLVRNCINMFPELRKAVPKLKSQHGNELWIVLDKELLPIEKVLMPPSKTKKIYLVPLIYGKGKIGMIIIGVILIVAIIALTIITAGGALAALGAGAAAAAEAGAAAGVAVGGIAATAGGIAAGAAAGAAVGGVAAAEVGATAAAVASTSFFSVSQYVSLGISILSSILQAVFAPSRNVPDGNTRKDNDAFSSLINTTAINTPIPLNYGMIRVSGQFVTGFIRSVNHSKDDVIRVSAYI